MKLVSRKLFESSVKDLFKDVHRGDIILDARSLSELPDDLPDEVVGDFYCDANKLISLKGCPNKVRGSFSCSYNMLTSLDGCPSIVEGDFACAHQNGKNFTFTKADVKKVCKVGGNIYV